MNIKTHAKRLLQAHREGKLNTGQFLHRLNRLITVRKDERTIIEEIEPGLYLVETTDARLIASIIDSDAKIHARQKDENNFTSKIRVTATDEQLDEIHCKSAVKTV
jgi:YbbR domain-containing protein